MGFPLRLVALAALVGLARSADNPFDPFGCMSVICRNKKAQESKNPNGTATDGGTTPGGGETDSQLGEDTLDFHFKGLYDVPTDELNTEKNKKNLQILYLSHNSISRIRVGDFPALGKLHTLLIDNNNLVEIEDGAFDALTGLINLFLEVNQLTRLPRFKKKTKITQLRVANNFISRISQADVRIHDQLKELYVENNRISNVHDEVFLHNHHMRLLDLSGNPLKRIDEEGLIGPQQLEQLYIRSTQISSIPTKGIQKLRYLDIRENPNLWQIPNPKHFAELQEIDLTYSSHCCAFQHAYNEYEIELNDIQSCKNINEGSADDQSTEEDTTTTPTPVTHATADFGSFDGFGGDFSTTDKDASTGDSAPTDSFGSFGDMGNFGGDNSHLPSSNGTHPSAVGNLGDDNSKSGLDHFVDDFGSKKTSAPPCSGKKIIDIPKRNLLKCRPKPDSFNPCDNVMGTDVLRIFSWFVALFAVLGNALLLLVLLSNKQSMTVYKLLMCNLGFANFLMGLYLLLLCCVDAYTYGKYFNFVRSWQYSAGCSVAGFLAIFSTELSLCSLSIITLERYLLIICALKVNMQMKLSHAKIAIALSWVYSLGLAAAPLSKQVSSYNKVAICLPFDMQNAWSTGYIVWLLLAYCISFVHVLYCYCRMYCTISSSGPSGSGTLSMDFKVAKRMALIVFSNFACWIPIALAGFIALYAPVTINVAVAKFLLVFVFPLNACTNPFLYAFFTKVFHGDVLEFLGRCGICRNKAKRYKEKRASYGRLRVGSRVSESVSATSSTALMSRGMRHPHEMESACVKDMTIEEHDDDSKYVHVDESPDEKKMMSSDESLLHVPSPLEVIIEKDYEGKPEKTRSESDASRNSQEMESLPRMRSVSDALAVLPEVELVKGGNENDRASPMTRITTL